MTSRKAPVRKAHSRVPPGLKIARPLRAVSDVARDADLGGLGLDWEVRPDLGSAGLAAWDHLAGQFAKQPTRFREADRAAVIAYCQAREMADLAAAALREHGVLVAGRSESDRSRPVRSPAWAMWRDASVQVRQWSIELALTPSSRRRAGVVDAADGADNPFMQGGS